MDYAEQFEKISNEYGLFISGTVCELLDLFGSNKKARAFLREQLAFHSDYQTHELINVLTRELERIALNQ